MLSVIVYGRNDNHGYNMHKRIAISLNCIAETLTHENDEILYVDYNTSSDLPTVIEAIQDTLTEKAKKLTRVFRVPPEVHEFFKDKTHAQVNEPLARNIAVRRSNPKNRWILSTNTDMVFTPLDDTKSLSDIVSKLEDGFYELARFDVPEPLWESLDRKDPINIIAKFREWGKSLHLNEVVYGNPIIKYDAPGDFQLVLREDIFHIDGFDEEMILGWHVDSNLCKRMYLYRGEVKSLQDSVHGYHCNHTRMSGWMHSTKRVENSIEKFFEKVSVPTLESQENWGLFNKAIEEIKVGQNDPTTNFPKIISSLITPMKENYTESFYNKNGYDKIYYSTEHVLPFLLEQFLNIPKGSNILYIGCNQFMLDKIEEFCSKYPSGHNLYYQQTISEEKEIAEQNLGYKLKPKLATKIALKDISAKIDFIVFDFGIDKKSLKDYTSIEFVRKTIDFQTFLLTLLAGQRFKKITKVICVNVHNTRYYKNVKKFLNPIQNPYCSGIMVGHIANNRAITKQFYKDILLRRITRLINKGNFLLLLIFFPIIFIFYFLKYKFTCFIKLFSLSKKRRDSVKKISKLILTKQIIL